MTYFIFFATHEMYIFFTSLDEIKVMTKFEYPLFKTWKLWHGIAVSVQWTIHHVRIEMRSSLLSFNMCWNFKKYPCACVIGNETGRLVKFVDLCRK